MTNLEGDTGPYIQYTYARTQSVIKKVNTLRVEPLKSLQGFDPNVEELSILKWIYRYPEVVAEASEKYAPHMVAGYVYELAARFNTFYNQHQIVGNEMRIMLTTATANILKSGLNLLGIVAPSEM
jgi:arginyl-tRNA synthetase